LSTHADSPKYSHWFNVVQKIKRGRPHFTVPVTMAGIRMDIHTDNVRIARECLDFYTAYISDQEVRGEIFIGADVSSADDGFEYQESLKHQWRNQYEESERGKSWFENNEVAAVHFETEEIPRSISFTKDQRIGVIQDLFRWFAPKVLLENGAILLRGAGVIKEGGGYVFYGPRGSSKSSCLEQICGFDEDVTVMGHNAVK